MPRPHMPDAELQSRLLGLGYSVPLVVIHSWAGAIRSDIETWVRGYRRNKRTFPQCLGKFDMRVQTFQRERKERK